MKKYKYQHLMVNALIAIALLQGNLNASDEGDIDEGLTNKLCRLMKARAEEQSQLEEKVQEEGKKCIEIAITLPRLALESVADYLAPRRPPTLLERVSTAATQATNVLGNLFKNPL